MQRSTQLLNNNYKKVRQIAEGSFSQILLCENVNAPTNENNEVDTENQNPNIIKEEVKLGPKPSKKFVAIKRKQNIEFTPEMNQEAFKEVQLLKSLDHPNIVKMLDVFIEKNKYNPESNQKTLCIVMDVYACIDDIKMRDVGIQEKKCIMFQLLKGLQYLHEKKIMHRDIKPANTFLSKDGVVLIGDVGSAKIFDKEKEVYTNPVTTKYYRAIEVILGSKNYDEKIDIWSLGCYFAELFSGEVLFHGEKGDFDLLHQIISLRGTPSTQNYPDYQKLPNCMKFKDPLMPVPLKDKISNMPEEVALIVERMLSLDPKKRPSVNELLKSDFFSDVKSPEKTGLAALVKPYYDNIYASQKK